MYVLYTTQSRLRISAPFYLIFNNVHVAIPTACIYIILFNFLKHTTQSRLRISAPFYLIFNNVHVAIPTACIYIILFNCQLMWDLIQNKNARGAFFYCVFIAHMCRNADLGHLYSDGLCMCPQVCM